MVLAFELWMERSHQLWDKTRTASQPPLRGDSEPASRRVMLDSKVRSLLGAVELEDSSYEAAGFFNWAECVADLDSWLNFLKLRSCNAFICIQSMLPFGGIFI